MKNRIDSNHWITKRPIAHRGLHGEGCAENSISAYLRAIEKNYPIEIDVHLTKDGQIAVFHDDTLDRVCGVNGKISDFTAEELKKFKLCGTQDVIPTFTEVLSTVNGKVPLLIEIKNHENIGKLEEMLVDSLKSYNGEFAIQSFNPLILKKIRKLAPETLRGQLACRNYGEDFSKLKTWFLGTLKSRILSKPDFVSYDVNALPNRYVNSKKYVLVCWTVRDENTQNKAESLGANIIFENFIPHSNF